jgi:hypothetical protein
MPGDWLRDDGVLPLKLGFSLLPGGTFRVHLSADPIKFVDK